MFGWLPLILFAAFVLPTGGNGGGDVESSGEDFLDPNADDPVVDDPTVPVVDDPADLDPDLTFPTDNPADLDPDLPPPTPDVPGTTTGGDTGDTSSPAVTATITTEGNVTTDLPASTGSAGEPLFTGTGGDDAIAIDPNIAADATIVAGDGADTITGGLFHSILAAGDTQADQVEVILTDSAVTAAATDGVAASQDGFDATLDPQDSITLTFEDDVEGTLLSLEMSFTTVNADGSTSVDFALGLFILPEGQTVPTGPVSLSEDEFIEALGLQKVGEIDLGETTTAVSAENGEQTIISDTRQSGLPEILSNRPIVSSSVIFS